MRIRAGLFTLVLALPLSSGCTSSGEEVQVGVLRARLQRAQSCGDLESMLRADASKKMNAEIDALVAATSQFGGGGWTSPPVFGAPSGTGSSVGMKEDTASSRATDYSETNTQVEGVDEADIVKNDGKYIYLLHGNQFMVLDAWPATALGQVSSFAVEGQPTEMYVAGGSVAVYSVVDGAPVYAAAGVEPRVPYFDAVRYDIRGGPAVGLAAPFPGYFSTPLTKITVLALNGTDATVVRELYFEGSYVSSRRVGEHVRTVIVGGGHGPALSFSPPSPLPTTPDGWRAAYEALRSENEAKIAAAGHADWLPFAFTRTPSGVTASQGACEDFYVPTAGSTEYGMTSVVALNVASTAAPRTATIVGAVDTVYSTADAMYLAARSWGDPSIAVAGWGATGGGSGGGGAVADAGTVEPGRDGGVPVEPLPGGTSSRSGNTGSLGRVAQRQEALVTLNRTHVHRFTFPTPDEPTYVASGTVPGTIDDQFSIDEHDGLLRVATTEERTTAAAGSWQVTRSNDVFVLETAGDELRTRGSLTGLAPDERIYSARFMGTKGYLVTFRQVDPLFALDLSDPAKPAVLGELEIPGFSEYMHPIDAGHLVTVGRDQGVAVQLFDVTDPSKPRLADKFVFTDDGYTEAAQSHKAFTYFASRGLLAFPYVGYSKTGAGMRSSLELFRVDTAKGLTHLGSIDHSAFFEASPYGYCGGYYGAQVRRGLFMEDFVYAVSYGGVTAHAVADLATPVASFALPTPESGFASCLGGL